MSERLREIALGFLKVGATAYGGPAVIGVLAVSLACLLPHAAPDRIAAVVLVLTVTALAVWRLAPLKVMLAGAVVGAVRSRVAAIPALRTLLGSAT